MTIEATSPTQDAWLLAIFDLIENPPVLEVMKALTPPLKAPQSKLYSCGRCGGTGVISQYRRVNGGVCFKCNGQGYTNS